MRDFSTQPRRRGPGPLELGLLALGGAALLFSAWSAVSARREGARVRASLDQARAEAQALQARAQGKDGLPVLAAQALLTADAPPSRIVSELANLMPGDVRLESLRLVYGARVEVEMRVAAREAASYDAFLDRLARSQAFADVLPGDENREGEVRAMVRAVWRGAGA